MKHVKGDLIKLALEGHFDVIVHGCNCKHTMGAGIAKTIAGVFPSAYTADKDTIYGDKDKLGTISYTLVKNNEGKTVVVVNAYTQFDYDNRKLQIDYDALELAFKQIKTLFHRYRIGYPAIGAGLAGGDWSRISGIINRVFGDKIDHTYVEFDG